jgi:N-acetylglucosaminyldiphosphoundecaprenol N-acetyl-beta-D-mannosaminyltransferase
MRVIEILGISIHGVTMAEVLAYAVECIKKRNVCLIMTPNAEILYTASRTSAVKDVLLEADLRIPDGSGLIWAARFQETPLPERVTGIDLMYRLLDYAAEQKMRVFFLGAHPDTIQKAVTAAEETWPGLRICGWQHGYFSDHEESVIIERIKQAKPEMLFVGMGAPRQEEWMVRNRHELNVPLMLGVGGSFDVLSGNLSRAPVWMQKSGLEWLFRLWREPKRIRRMLLLPPFVGAVVKEKYFTGRHVGDHEK